jgi:O-antigen/teichoic acid export membrane protein
VSLDARDAPDAASTAPRSPAATGRHAAAATAQQATTAAGRHAAPDARLSSDGVTDSAGTLGSAGTPDSAGTIDVGKIARAGALNLVGAAVSVVATVGLTIVITRNADKDVAGAYFTLTSIFLILCAAARLGADTGAVYTIASLRARHETSRVRAAMRVAYAPTLAISGLLLVVIWFAAPWLARELFAAETPATVTAIRIFGLCLPFAVLTTVAEAAARGLGRGRPYILFDRMLRPLLQMIGAVAVVLLLGETAWVGLAATYAAPFALTAIIMVPWLAKMRRRAERSDRQAARATSAADWSGFWRFSAPRAGTTLISLALQRLDVIIVAAIRGASDAALYTAATRFLVVGQTAANALSVAVQHRFGALLSVGRTADANRLYQLTTTWLILMIWPFYLTWAVFAGRLMAIFGGGYVSAKTVGIVLALTMLVATACGMVSMVLEMAGNTGVTLLQTGAALVIDIVLDLLLVPHLGPLGAAIGWAGALLFNNLVPLATLYRRYRLYPISRAGATAMAVAAVCFAGVPMLGRATFGDRPATDAIAFVVGLAAYAVVVWQRREALDLAELRTMVRRGRRK